MNDALHTTLADAVEFLRDHQVPYALIGGLAVSIHGMPRVTMDVDLVVAIDVERAVKLAGALSQSRFLPLFPDVNEVIERSFILPLRHRTTNVKVDLPIGMSGFERQVVARAETHQVAGISLSVATTEDLLIMKVLAGRPQDDTDVQGLLIAQSDKLDWEYCQATAAELGEAIGVDLAGRLQMLRDETA